MKIQPNSTLVMIGDSITDCQRARPVGAGSPEALGKGYVSFVDTLLAACYPDHHIQVVNKGIAGDTVRDLEVRWQADVLDLKPDWLSVCIGINDVWQQFDGKRHAAPLVSLDEYEQTLDQLVEAAKPALAGLILMTPYFVESNRAAPLRAAMDRYGEAVKRLAQRHHAVLVDTQAAFDAASIHLGPAALTRDGAHPTQIGHMLLARAFLRALGFAWERGDS